ICGSIFVASVFHKVEFPGPVVRCGMGFHAATAAIVPSHECLWMNPLGRSIGFSSYLKHLLTGGSCCVMLRHGLDFVENVCICGWVPKFLGVIVIFYCEEGSMSGARVLSTEEAKTAIRQIQSIVNG